MMKRRMVLLSTLIILIASAFVAVYKDEAEAYQNRYEVNNSMNQDVIRHITPENKENQPKQAYSDSLQKALAVVSIPEDYTLQHVHSQKQNQHDVWVFRYEKADGENNGLGGEHFSFVTDQTSHRLLGVTWMDDRLSTGELPNKEQTQLIARAFLDRVEPGLFPKLENLWIDKHTEVITVQGQTGAKEVTITGIKYKCYRKDTDDYTWVIVGPGGTIIAFEQGIVWQGGRVTEKWLHDTWLKEQQETT